MKAAKKPIFLLLIIFAASFSFAQQSPVKSFMKEIKHRNKSEVRKLTVGRLPIIVAKWFVDDDLKPLMKHVRKVRFLNTASSDLISSQDWKQLSKNMSGAGYEKMLMVNQGGSDVALHMKGEDDRMKLVTAIVKDGGSDIVVEFKTKLTFDRMAKLITDYLE